MANSYSRKIQERIRDAAEGTVFIGADFADIADTETVRRNLNRLTQAGLIRRVLLEHCPVREYSSEFAGTFYTGNRGLVLYQRWSL